MAERIGHDSVEGIRVGRFPGQINTTCIVYRLGSTVIDTGPPNQWRTVRRFLEEREVRQIVVTHHHEDHSGNLAAAEGLAGDGRDAPALYAPETSLERLRRGFPLRLYQHVAWGRPRPCLAEPLPEEIRVEGGGTLLPLRAPGHSDDMTCFLEPDRGWLFTGDLYISSKTKYLRSDEDLRTQLESLRHVLEVDFDTVFCSHRGPIASGKAALQKKLDYLTRLRDEVRHLHSEGRGVGEISRLLLGREDGMSWWTCFHFSKRNLIRACLDGL